MAALSRLRNHPFVSRAPSLLRARLLSSTSRSISRNSRLQNSILGDGGTLLRPKLSSAFDGVHDQSILKLWIGIRCYSSAASKGRKMTMAYGR